MLVGCVMQNRVTSRRFSSGSEDNKASDDESMVLEIPIPDRQLLRHLVVVDGVESNDKDVVKRNKLIWMISSIIDRFPKRKFLGLRQCLSYLVDEGLIELSGSQFSRAYESISRVQRYGGEYQDFVDALYSA